MDLLTANDRPGRYPDSWYAATARPPSPFPRLQGEVQADVCVIGGGYTGLSAALHLRGLGYDVALLDAQRVGFGASGRNGGQLGSGQRLSQAELERRVGRDDARRLWDIAEQAKATARTLIATHGIDAALKTGVAHAAHTAAALEAESAEAEHLAREYGYSLIEPLDRADIATLTGSDVFRGGTLDRGAGHLHPLRFAFGLAAAASRAGVRIHEASRVLRLAGGAVETDAGRLVAPRIVLAANGYLGRLEGRTAARVMPINNFILATEPLDRFPEILPGDEAVADSKFVVNYWRKSEDNRLLFGGGENYGYRFPADIAAKPLKPMLKLYPQLKGVRIDYAWGGTLAITPTRLPYFARPRPGLWTASGYSGHGVAMAVMAGRILAEAIHGEAARFDLMASLKPPAFPGGPWLRSPILALAMTWYSLRDRLGF